jgi:hypothetical protein
MWENEAWSGEGTYLGSKASCTSKISCSHHPTHPGNEHLIIVLEYPHLLTMLLYYL